MIPAMGEFITEFVYSPTNVDNPISVQIDLPLALDVEELVHTLIINNNLPVFKDREIIDNLSDFVKKEEDEFYNINTVQLIDTAKNDKESIEKIIKEWEKLIREETAEYGERRCASDEELFATAYHRMVHSPALETMVHLEYMYAQTVRQKTEEKDKLIHALADKQTEEMNKAVDRLEEDMTEMKINELVAKHYEDHSMLIVKLTSEIDTIKEAQRREYREWLMQMLEQNETSSSLPTPKNSPLTPSSVEPLSYGSPRTRISEVSILEESFTIHLGSQLKQMHNIRILSANVMDHCAVYNSAELSEPTPQLLQTALGLYSNDLYGLVLMTDNKIGSRLTEDFQEICRNSTDFHFVNIDDQLDKISVTLQKYIKNQNNDGDIRSVHSELLQMGDFYMTKHSNLSQAHVIFHMVSDESLRGNDINSRHPVVLGLRNILKTACSNDITSLTIPLLLQYEMTEEMTISWCEKRAELIFKCVKGFMIEMASWGGSELKNLQFMLPQGISVQVFQSLTEMLPRIFKVSNPKILK